MDEMSNKTLAALLVIAIVVSIGGTMISVYRISKFQIPIITQIAGITGFATGTGTTNLSITSQTSISFTNSLVDWGDGYVNSSSPGCSTCNMSTYNTSSDKNTSCCVGTDWPNNAQDGLWLENTGNNPVNLNVTSNKTGAQFIGTGAKFMWNFSPSSSATWSAGGGSVNDDDTSNSCEQHNISGVMSGGMHNWTNTTDWSDVVTTSFWACGNGTIYPFNYTNLKNEVEINFFITVPATVATGKKEARITVVAASAAGS